MTSRTYRIAAGLVVAAVVSTALALFFLRKEKRHDSIARHLSERIAVASEALTRLEAGSRSSAERADGLARRVIDLEAEVEAVRKSNSDLVPTAEGLLNLTSRLKDGEFKEDSYLNIPSLKRDGAFYSPLFVAGPIRYIGNKTSPEVRDHMYVLRQLSPGDAPVVFSEGPFLHEGDEFDVVEDRLHDFDVGNTFVKVKRRSDFAEGYLTLETFFSETVPVSVPPGPTPYPLSATFDGTLVLLPLNVSEVSAAAAIGKLTAERLEDVFATPLTGGTVHPVTATNEAFALASALMVLPPGHALRAPGLEALTRFFDRYAVPRAVAVRPDALAWPNDYDFPIPWNITLKAPWYSAYSNGQMAATAAAMHRLTGEARYADIARKAVNWLRLPMEEGGARYGREGFVFLAEYAYRSPPLSNIRVFDGELISAVAVYNTAALLRDAEMMRFAARVAYSLCTQLRAFTTRDGRIQNARYQWLVDTDAYVVPMQRMAIELGIVTKDRRYFEAAATWRRSDVYWPP